jgi:hypothetical protein
MGRSVYGLSAGKPSYACYNLLEWTGANWLVRMVNETAHLKGVAGHLKSDF